MKQVQENLEQYRENKFFAELYERVGGPNWKREEDKGKEDKDKKDKNSEKKNEKDPKQEQAEKEKAQALKDAKQVFKKLRDNFGRFKTAAKDNIKSYKEFLEKQNKAMQVITQKDAAVTKVYDMYDSNYAAILKTVGTTPTFMVIKKQLEEGEENPIYSVADESVVNEFKEFLGNVKSDMRAAKDHYVKTVENKKKEEENQKQQEKLGKFLKESKKK